MEKEPMLTPEDIEWLTRMTAEGDTDDPQFVRFCESELTLDLKYLDAATDWANRYTRRLNKTIKQRIQERRHEVRYRACVELQELCKQPDFQKSYQTLEVAVRTCAWKAFLNVHKVVFEEVIEMTHPSERSSPTAR
jgi:hypothetical protein